MTQTAPITKQNRQLLKNMTNKSEQSFQRGAGGKDKEALGMMLSIISLQETQIRATVSYLHTHKTAKTDNAKIWQEFGQRTLGHHRSQDLEMAQGIPEKQSANFSLKNSSELSYVFTYQATKTGNEHGYSW